MFDYVREELIKSMPTYQYEWSDTDIRHARNVLKGLVTRQHEQDYLKYKENPKDADLKKTHKANGRSLSNGLHDINGKFSGLISKRALEYKAEQKDFRLVNEHYEGRNNSGEKLIEWFVNNDMYNKGWKLKTLDNHLAEFIFVLTPHCMVHKTTKEENLKLSEFQNDPKIKTWQDCYTKAKINLIEIGVIHPTTGNKIAITQKTAQHFLREYTEGRLKLVTL